jgi:hypothetical protein
LEKLAEGFFSLTSLALFNAVHLELAWIYRNIARTTPLAINDLDLDEEEEEKEEKLHDKWMAANLIAPLIFAVFVSYEKLGCEDRHCGVTKTAWAVSYIAVILLQVISGMYLIAALKDIRFFFIGNKATDHLNIKEMALHGTAFGLYLIAAAVYAVA